MQDSGARDLTPEEARSVRSLKRLAKTWPQTIKLFSWSGALTVMDAEVNPGNAAILDEIYGIPNDGGDPR